MEVALTFGSLGDIIQLFQIAIQLVRAIGFGRGAIGESAAKYQELRNDLDIFVRILMQVVATYEQHESSPYLEGLDNVSKCVVNQCTSDIQDAFDYFQSRYQNSLHPGGSGKKIKDVFKKVEWATREKDRLRCLREKLKEGIQRLSLLTSLAAEKSARADNVTMLARIDRVQQLVSRTCASQEEVLSLLQHQRKASEKQEEKLEEVSQQLAIQDNSSRSILAVAKDALCGILEVKDLLFQVSKNVINLQIMASNTMFIRLLDPTRELPVIIEDALGRKLPIPAQWLDSLEWEVLYHLLSGSFKGRKGHEMVVRREYALEESASGRDLDSARPLHLCLRRGMKINMSMIFQTAEIVIGACPRCGTESDAPEGVTVQCPKRDCGMWFRMQKAEFRERFAKSPFRDGESDSKSMALKGTAITSIPVEPGEFQRVRILRLDSAPCLKLMQIATEQTEANTRGRNTIFVTGMDRLKEIIHQKNDERELVKHVLEATRPIRNGKLTLIADKVAEEWCRKPRIRRQLLSKEETT
ncbi:hypothetical protein NUW58_g5402 [Xylaria curta]|uniref:Uncharacterized protein n=1 Tax=Xylaria curta TaxID=42375 RepID=A0ACC1P313_9PEZI|nr:hypothetical protein NUW58_g5402 [Xylaria curta]